MKIVLHLGGHRTGSTMVEQTLSQSIAARPDLGIAVWTPRVLREVPGFLEAETFWDADGNPTDDEAAKRALKIQGQLTDMIGVERDKNTQTLVISEENIIGSMRRNFKFGRFYPRTDERQRAFARLFPFVPDVLALGVRNYASAWTSARDYAHQRGHERALKDEHRDAIPEKKRGWVEVVKGAQAAWPSAQMIAWCQEDLHEHARPIVAALAGVDEADIVVPKRPVNAVRDSQRQAPIFTPDETAMMQTRYENHILRLQAAQHDVTWVPFGGG